MSQEPLRIYKTMCGKVKKEIKNREQATEIKNKKQTSLEKIIVKESGNRAKIVRFFNIESISTGFNRC